MLKVLSNFPSEWTEDGDLQANLRALNRPPVSRFSEHELTMVISSICPPRQTVWVRLVFKKILFILIFIIYQLFTIYPLS